ncbi:MAG: hypothetical protein ABL893_17905, partial [Hyphomicrobium sp.]
MSYAISGGVVEGGSIEARFWTFWKSPPNSFGDALAGIFAPLAFLWLVVGVFVQKDELSQQLKEFQHSV